MLLFLFGFSDAFVDVLLGMHEFAQFLVHLLLEQDLLLFKLFNVGLVFLTLIDQEQVLVFKLGKDLHEFVWRFKRHWVLRIFVRVFDQLEEFVVDLKVKKGLVVFVI